MINIMKRLILFGPVLFGVVVTTLSIVKYPFMRGLGWHPLNDPTFDWPSGLALGPYGIVMTATFIISGLLMFIFALRLRADLGTGWPSQIGSAFLAGSGLALAALAFTTDPTLTTITRSWHGILHDSAFVLLGLTLLPAMIMLGRAFQSSSRWQGFGIYTWLTAAFAIPSFFLKGAAFYVFLFLILLWNEIIAWRLYKLDKGK
jgi:hypothetical protein